MIETLGICDNGQSIEAISQMSHVVAMSKFVKFEECTPELTRQFKVLFFVLNPENIGNSFFLDRISEILAFRKSTKSIYFIIDGIEKLTLKERFKVKLELEKALLNKIEHPQIVGVSLVLASAYYSYKIGRITLESIQKDKRIMLLDEEGYTINGKALTGVHIKRFEEESKIKELVAIIENELPKFQQVDVERICWGVLGTQGSGKTSLIKVLEELRPKVGLVELQNLDEATNQILEGILVLLDLDHERNKQYLMQIKSQLHDKPFLILMSHADCCMNHGGMRRDEEMLAEAYCKQILGQGIEKSLSIYYASQAIALEKEEITIEDLMEDPEIVLLDSYSLPIITYRSSSHYKTLFNKQNDIQEIQEIGDKICSNHS